MVVQRYKRGQIWWMRDNSPEFKEHLQSGTRPVILVSNDAANRFSNNITVIPCTTADKKDLPTHVKLEINGPSTALCEGVITISNSSLMTYIGTCDTELMNKIDEALCVALGIINKDKMTESIITLDLDTKLEMNKLGNTVKDIPSNGTTLTKCTRGRKSITLEDKQRFVNDYENHDNEYMLKKYNLKDIRALQQRVYMFRKAIREVS